MYVEAWETKVLTKEIEELTIIHRFSLGNIGGWPISKRRRLYNVCRTLSLKEQERNDK